MKTNAPTLYWALLIIALLGFLQNYTSSAIAGALPFISWEFSLTPLQEGQLAGILLFTALLGCIASGIFADRFGRKKTLFFALFLYCLSHWGVFFTKTYTSLLCLRLWTGFTTGAISVIAPLYLAEIAPPSKRGAFVTCFQLAISLGNLFAYFSNHWFTPSGNWRSMLGLALYPAAFSLLALLFVPESSRWFAGLEERGSSPPWKTLFEKPMRKVFGIALLAISIQQLDGIHALTFFAPKIFREAGFTDPKEITPFLLAMGFLVLFSCSLALTLIDRVGRRKLLLFSQMGVVFSLFFLDLTFFFQGKWLGPFAVFGVLLYIGLFTLGVAMVPMVLATEIFPLPVRARAMSLVNVLGALIGYLVTLTFPSLLVQGGMVGSLTLYSIFSILGFILFWLYIPETSITQTRTSTN